MRRLHGALPGRCGGLSSSEIVVGKAQRRNEQRGDSGRSIACNARFNRGAPHLLAVHASIGKGEWVFDTAISLAYAELEMMCNDLGFIYVSTPWSALQTCPRARAFLQIPEDHHISCFAGFGYPAYQFPRGVQRSDALRINRIVSETERELY